VWDVSKVTEVVLTRVEPGSIGLSAIGAHLPRPLGPRAAGLYLRLGAGGRRVLAPIAPGLVEDVGVVLARPLADGDEVTLSPPRPCVLALDGEREIALRAGESVAVRLQTQGPRIVDVRAALAQAADAGVFVAEQPRAYSL
jgi:hypothetical protein